MVLAKKSIFLFAFIIGISVLPNGSSGGPVYANPSSNRINEGLKKLGTHAEKQDPSTNHVRVFGTVFNNLGSQIVATNVKGDIIIGSRTNQTDNVYNPKPSSSLDIFGSLNTLGYNSFQISNVEGKITVGSETYQKNNKY